jgi:uncharacterized protein YndB with AHSA1/START domain
MKTDPVIIERTFSVPASKVWEALTDAKKMKEWYFNIENFKPEVGFKFQFLAGSENKSYLHICKVTEAEEGKKLTYTWNYDNYPGNSSVTFELFEAGTGTRVKLTHSGLETFPSKDNANFSKESFTAGWKEIIGTNLKAYLDK